MMWVMAADRDDPPRSRFIVELLGCDCVALRLR